MAEHRPTERRVTWPHHCPTWDSPGGCRCVIGPPPAADRPTEGGDREGLARVLCRFWDEDEFENDASRHSFGAPFPCPACTAEAAEILASDWLRDHDAAVRAEALEALADFIEFEMAAAWGGNGGWLTGNHVAGLVAGMLRDPEVLSEARDAARTPGGDR